MKIFEKKTGETFRCLPNIEEPLFKYIKTGFSVATYFDATRHLNNKVVNKEE